MTVHPALHIDCLKRLPSSKRLLANAAMSDHRTLKDLQLVRMHVLAAPQSQRKLMLPVLYFNINPAEVPDMDIFESQANVVAAANGCIERAIDAIRSLYALDLPAGIGIDLWPRVWPWFRFLFLYQHQNPTGNSAIDQRFCVDFLMFAGGLADHKETSDLITATPCFWFMLGRTWHCVPAIPDPHRRILAFNELRYFIVNKKLLESTNLEELLDGAGGTWSDLAHLVVLSMDVLTPKNENVMDSSEIYFFHSGIMFLILVDPALEDPQKQSPTLSQLGEALLSHGILSVLRDGMLALIKTAESSTVPALYACFNVLTVFFVTNSGCAKLPEAITDGLLTTLILCARSRFGQDVHGQLGIYFKQLLSAAAIDYRVLSALDAFWPDIDQLTDDPAFEPSGLVHESWTVFRSLVDERLQLLHEFKRSNTSFRACDNLDPGTKHEFRRCSGCRSSYYCSPACQIADWRNGGHREACNSCGTLLLSERNNNNFNAQQRSFLRVLVHHDYQKERFTLQLKQVVFKAKLPHTEFVTLYDYTRGAVEIDIMAARRVMLSSPEWRSISSRAAASHGRMGIDVVYLGRSAGSTCLVVPLRSSSSVIHDKLAMLANELPSGLPLDTEWDPHVVADEIESILRHDGANVVEIH
ncbi:MYND-type domain-containing protein [Favolaschia claudopus]|uniref:MYND-type domain-containing protein n=1 Tax=Favolaschia claudopus TaxID=2862362 RepID=A0AAV9ZKS0_9AGAR